MASEPASVSAIRSGRVDLNEPCVRYRWNPVPMPIPVMTSSTTVMATSSQVRPHPHATGTAATSAAKGRMTNAQSANRTPAPCLPSVSGFEPDGDGVFSRTDADMAPRRGCEGDIDGSFYAYVTVTYATVGPHVSALSVVAIRRPVGRQITPFRPLNLYGA